MNYFIIIFHKLLTITVCENSNSFYAGAWCNGSTRDFGSLNMSSNLVVPTTINNNGINCFVNFKLKC